jgi:hypothetical protein
VTPSCKPGKTLPRGQRTEDERAITRAFATLGRAGSWQHAPEYLLRSLPEHAHAGGLVDELLTDDAYLLHADLRRLDQVTYDVTSPSGRRRAELLRLTPEAITAAPAERAAMFSITEALDNLGSTYRASRWQAPYQPQWAVAQPRTERSTFDNFTTAVCTVPVDGRVLLASGGARGMVRLWDPQTGEQLAVLEGHRNPSLVQAVCAVTVDGRELLASGSSDSTVRLWDPQTGEQLAVLEERQHPVQAVCAVTVDGRELLASGGEDGTVRLWDLQTGEQLAVLEDHQRLVMSVCTVTVDGRELLASGDFHTVRLWDPRDSSQLTVLEGHHDYVRTVCAITVDGRELLASGDWDTVRLWDPRNSRLVAVLEGHQDRVNAVCAVTVDGRALLASCSADETVRLWDLGTGTCVLTTPVHHAAMGIAEVADSLAIGLDSGIIVVKPNAVN